MKNSLLLCVATIITSVMSSQSIQWSEPVTVAQFAGGEIFSKPQVAVTESGIVNVVWASNQEDVSYPMHTRKIGASFDPAVLLGEGSEIQTYEGLYGPHIASQGEVVFVVYEKTPELNQGSIVSVKSPNAGLSWAGEVNVEEYINGDHGAHPHLAIDGGGHPHVSMTRYNGTQSDVGAICSVNLGQSYTAFIPASDETLAMYVNPPFLVIEDDIHIVLWMEDQSGIQTLNVAISTNNGATFGGPVVLNDMVYPNEDLEGLELMGAIMDGYLYLTWTSYLPNFDVRISRLSISELVADVNTLISEPEDDLIPATSPSIAAGNGIVTVAWQSGFQSESDIWVSTSFNYPEVPETSYIWDQSANRHSPNLCFQDGFHLVFINEDEQAIQYVFGEVVDDTGMPAFENPVVLEVYPNPAGEKLNVKLTHSGNYQNLLYFIYDAKGGVIQQGDLESEIDVSKLPSGSYSLAVGMGEQMKTTGFVKK